MFQKYVLKKFLHITKLPAFFESQVLKKGKIDLNMNLLTFELYVTI